ncbi:unnamed protein product [Trichogramma brassicae]|uniref:Uncharacterized protein n=1 Tax=Trichogramma brassicae TaxID=86971 RepID=A0A6H5IKB0_9HYME|nr:unnamed protein product [Trichogramma brassicae]
MPLVLDLEDVKTVQDARRYSADKCAEEWITTCGLTYIAGIDILRHEIERLILSETGRSIMKMRVESGSEAFAWLYKEATLRASTHTHTHTHTNIYTIRLERFHTCVCRSCGHFVDAARQLSCHVARAVNFKRAMCRYVFSAISTARSSSRRGTPTSDMYLIE